MNKGFTLIEMLGVITLLAILALVTIPVVNNSLNNSRQRLAKTNEKQIIKAAKSYYAENLNKIPENGSTCVSINRLQSEGYLDKEVKDPETDSDYNTNCNVILAVTKGKANDDEAYSYKFDCTNPCD